MSQTAPVIFEGSPMPRILRKTWGDGVWTVDELIVIGYKREEASQIVISVQEIYASNLEIYGENYAASFRAQVFLPLGAPSLENICIALCATQHLGAPNFEVTASGNLRCPLGCDSEYKRQDSVTRHIRDAHINKDVKFSCLDCGKKYKTEEGVTRHKCSVKTESAWVHETSWHDWELILMEWTL